MIRKSRVLTSFSLVALIVGTLIACAGDGLGQVSVYVGNWANPAYNGGGPAARNVMTENSATLYTKTTDDSNSPSAIMSFTITDHWTSGGVHYFKMFFATSPFGGPGYALARVSNNNNTLEFAISPTDYPATIDPTDPTYAIWYRQ
jgi:hypothetical protein